MIFIIIFWWVWNIVSLVKLKIIRVYKYSNIFSIRLYIKMVISIFNIIKILVCVVVMIKIKSNGMVKGIVLNIMIKILFIKIFWLWKGNGKYLIRLLLVKKML